MGIGLICCEKPKDEQIKLQSPNNFIFGNNGEDIIHFDKNNKRSKNLKNNLLSENKLTDNVYNFRPKNFKNATFNIPKDREKEQDKNKEKDKEKDKDNEKDKEKDKNKDKEKDLILLKKEKVTNEDEDFFSNMSNIKFQEKSNPELNSLLGGCPENLNINSNFDYSIFSKIVFYFESFELTYKKYDDYGLSISPMIFIKIDASHEAILDKQNEGEYDNIKTLQGNMTENISFNNTFMGKTIVKDDNMTVGPGKSFSINSTYSLDLENYETWRYKIFRIKIFNKSKSSQYNPIIMGTIAFPLSSIILEGLEGKIPIKNKLLKNIGHLNTRISFLQKDNTFFGKYSNNSLSPKDDNKILNLESMGNNNNLTDFNAEEENLNAINTHFYVPIESNANFIFDNYNICLMSYENIDLIIKEKFKIKKNDPNSKLSNDEKFSETLSQRKNQLNKINEIDLEMPSKKVASMLLEGILNQNHIIIYAVLKFLCENFQNFNKKYFFDLFNVLLDNKRTFNFINLYEDLFKTKNFFLSKVYFLFLYKSIIHYKSQEISTGSSEGTILNFEEIFNLILDSLNFLYKSCGELKNYNYEILEELRETLYWIYSCVIELISAISTENFTDEESAKSSNFIYFNNSLQIINNPNTIIDIFILLNEDSELTGFVSRIFRKSIQNVLDDLNVYKNMPLLEKNNFVNESLKGLIADPEKAQKFISFVQICLMRYINYPEIYSNILLIIICLCNENKYPEMIRNLLDNLDISLICSGFDNYRGNLKKIGKNINYFFYKLISQIINVSGNENINQISTSEKKIGNEYNSLTSTKSKKLEKEGLIINKHEIKEICNEIIKLFKLKNLPNGKNEKSKILVNFLKSKNLELHEILCCIASNITRYQEACVFLCKDKCFFFNNILQYFIELNKNSIEKTLERHKNQKREKIPLYLSIIYNSLICFNNIIRKYPKQKEYFVTLLGEYDLEPKAFCEHINSLVNSCMTLFNLNGESNNKIVNIADEFFININK
jgi:hypothetical protein